MPEALDATQRQAVESEAPILRVLAGAGSGKTRVLTQRVAERVKAGTADAAHTLVLTFTRKAADELRERLVRTGVASSLTTGTFHAVAYGELRRHYLEQGSAVPAISNSPVRILEAALTELKMNRVNNARGLQNEIAWAKSHCVDPEHYAEAVQRFRRRTPLSPDHMSRLYAAYETERRRRRVLDFDDLLLVLTSLIERDAQFAAAQRWRLRHFFVDEFQDLNPAQFALLRAWLGDRDDLFVVGDPNQAIYGWNGADASFLTDLDQWFPKLETVRLRTNYRSTPQVLAAASAVLPNTFGDHGGEDGNGEPPTLRRYPDEKVEAVGIARHLRLVCSSGRTWSDAAVLVRTNAQRAVIETALAASNIPYRSAGGAGWLYRPEIRDAIEHLRTFGIRKLNEVVSDLDQFIEETPEHAILYGELRTMVQTRLSEDAELSVRDFLSWLEVASRFDAAPSAQNAVTVTTFHRAKGLEWPVVFLAGVEEGLVPFGNVRGKELEEEQRLFYVALTRAREEVHCSFAAQRTGNNGPSTQTPSRWLTSVAHARIEEMDPTVIEVREHVSESRTLLHREPSPVDPARERLCQWRDRQSRLTGIAPEVILSDELVDDLIDLRPANRDEIAAVDGIGAIRAAAIGDQLVDLLRS